MDDGLLDPQIKKQPPSLSDSDQDTSVEDNSPVKPIPDFPEVNEKQSTDEEQVDQLPEDLEKPLETDT